MQLSAQDCRLFYKLHPALMLYANQKLRVIQDQPADSREYACLAPEKRVEVRDALHAKPDLLDQFVRENPSGFTSEELEIVAGWKQAVVGGFYIFRYLKGYTIFLSSEAACKAYGVLALADPLERLVGPCLPRMIETVLLPFHGKIVYDGLLSGYNLSFGGGIKRMLSEEYKKAKAAFGIITSLPLVVEPKEPQPPDKEEAVIVTCDCCGEPQITRIGSQREPTLVLRLTQAQRRAVADLLPEFTDRMQLEEPNQRSPKFTLDELRRIASHASRALDSPMRLAQRDRLGRIIEAAEETLGQQRDGNIAQIPASQRLYQFKITLKDVQPPIWRRIQVKGCTLDRLHEHIQTAMGWTNSHLHQFTIGGVLYGDPESLLEEFNDGPELVNSLETPISKIVPQDGKRFTFDYEYDFGDCWRHEVLFEGCLRAEKGARYPLCLEGERACPPEDIGGTYGYQDYLDALADPDHAEHESFMKWSGSFDPENFDAEATTMRMRHGSPNRREVD